MKRAFFVLFASLIFATAAHGQSKPAISQFFAFACQPYPTCLDYTKPDSIFQASDGNFYGLTGGPDGTIFKLTEPGQMTVLYVFKPNTRTGFFDQGSYPAALVEASDGFLYGVASDGPTSSSSGTIFKLSKTGADFQVLKTFCFSCTSGSAPDSLVVGTDGNMYGTTGYGGFFGSSPHCQNLGCGVVFRLTPPGTYTVLHALNGTTESSIPLGVTQATDGNLYGTAGYFTTGTIFRVNPANSQFTTLYTFPAYIFPLNRVTQASNGRLYGSTRPTYATNGSFPVTIFSSTLEGGVQNLQQITLPAKKKFAVGPLLHATDSNLWTTSYVGGPSVYSWGLLFSFTPSGALVNDLPFSPAVGVYPVGGVIQAKDGTLLGTATADGTDSNGKTAYGTIYAIKGLPPR